MSERIEVEFEGQSGTRVEINISNFPKRINDRVLGFDGEISLENLGSILNSSKEDDSLPLNSSVRFMPGFQRPKEDFIPTDELNSKADDENFEAPMIIYLYELHTPNSEGSKSTISIADMNGVESTGSLVISPITLTNTISFKVTFTIAQTISNQCKRLKITIPAIWKKELLPGSVEFYDYEFVRFGDNPKKFEWIDITDCPCRKNIPDFHPQETYKVSDSGFSLEKKIEIAASSGIEVKMPVLKESKVTFKVNVSRTITYKYELTPNYEYSTGFSFERNSWVWHCIKIQPVSEGS